MKYKLKFVKNTDKDFKSLKKEGFGGVIFPACFVNSKDLETARKNGLKRLVHIGDMSKIACEHLDGDDVKKGEILTVTSKTVKKTIKSLKTLLPKIDGFYISYPCVGGLLWDSTFPEEYRNFCGRNLYDELPLLFDADTPYAEVRIWYYNRVSKKLFDEFILPVCDSISILGKKAYFNIGNADRDDYFVRKLIMPSLFYREKLSVVVEEKGERHLIKQGKKAETLFVSPMRAIMGMYAWNMPYSKEESEFSLAVCETAYYKNSLEKCGISSDIVDDFTLSDMRVSTLKRYENILLAKGCMIEKRKKDKLIDLGIKVDSRELLERLDKVN
ncbi:MAG: hypothetical protein IKR46_03460 [Clostridia bacterium]|nr:hypothetical protein [Clostridia bacterium]